MSERLRVLIVRVGAMGDVLHALPAVAGLKRREPDAIVDWVIDERWEPLLKGDADEPALVHRTFPVSTRRWKEHPLAWSTARDFLGFRRLQKRYHVVVDMQGTLRSALIGWLSTGGRHCELFGYAQPRERQAAWFYDRKVSRRARHVVDQGAALLARATGLELEAADVAIPRRAAAEEWAERDAVLRRPMALLAAGGGWRAKQWAPERYGEVARGLAQRGYDVVVNAARADDAIADTVVRTSGGTARAVVCDVAGLIALMRRTDLCVGGDTGPMHLAAMMGVPVVALFGPTSPERNGPWGPGPKRVLRDAASVTHYKRLEEPDAGLERLEVGQVLAAVDEVLGSSS